MTTPEMSAQVLVAPLGILLSRLIMTMVDSGRVQRVTIAGRCFWTTQQRPLCFSANFVLGWSV